MNKDNSNKINQACCTTPSERDLGQSFWDQQYQSNTTGWDMGEVSPPIKAYADELTNKNIRILIPGCGNAYEAAYLLEAGFTDITAIDIAPTLVEKLKQQFANHPNIKIILGDFFEHKGQYDLIIEQTFFCALDPILRSAYVKKMHELLAENGKLAGVLFNRTFEFQGPPFGGTAEEYQPMFAPYFNLCHFEPCYNSYFKRADTELFIELEKK